MGSVFLMDLINLFFGSIAPSTTLNAGCEGFIAAFEEPESS